MTDFPDVERFGNEHIACGGITPSAAAHPDGGFVLSLSCACGATLERPVTLEEARRPLPLPSRALAPSARAASRPRRPASPTPSADLEAARRETPAEQPEPSTAPRASGPAGGDLAGVVRAKLDGDDRPAAPPVAPPARPVWARAGPPRPAPAKPNLDTTTRTALSQRAEPRLPRPAASRGTRVVWLALFAILALGAAAALHLTTTSDAPPVPAPVVARAVVPPDRQQRAALDEVMKSLRQLQAASIPNTSLSVYSSRVLFAESDVERLLASASPGADRTRAREVIDIHVLVVAAWKARTLEQNDAWEAIGQDPAIDLCPSVKRVVDFAVPSPGVSRAQTRGQAVAGAISLLWECSAEKIAALDASLAPPTP